MHVLMYCSQCLVQKAHVDTELSLILHGARVKNAWLGITGVLVMYEDRFAQLLEGPELVVHALFKQIKRDVRHDHVEVLQDTDAEHRTFDGWAMAHVGEHGELDTPLLADDDHVTPDGPWRTNAAQEALLGYLRLATRGYGIGS